MSLRDKLQLFNQKPIKNQLKRNLSSISLRSIPHTAKDIVEVSEIQKNKGNSLIRKTSLKDIRQDQIVKPQLNLEKFKKKPTSNQHNLNGKRGLWKNLKPNINKENQFDNGEKTKADSVQNKQEQIQLSKEQQKNKQKKFERFSGKKNNGENLKKVTLLPKYSLMTPPKLENKLSDSVENSNMNEQKIVKLEKKEPQSDYMTESIQQNKQKCFQILEESQEGDQTLDHIFVVSEQSYQNSFQIQHSAQDSSGKSQILKPKDSNLRNLNLLNQKTHLYQPLKYIKDTRKIVEYRKININAQSIRFQSPKIILNTRFGLQCRQAQSAQVNQNEI